MKSLAIVIVAAAGFAGCGSGTSALAYCDQFQTEICDKVFQCADPSMPPDPTLWGASPADCATMAKASNCAGVTNANSCPDRESFHPDKADACLRDLAAADCMSFNNGFTSPNCMAVCA